MSEFTGRALADHVIGYPDAPLRIPLWVRARLARLGPDFVGQIVLNVYEGGITNFQVRPRGGDAVTFHL